MNDLTLSPIPNGKQCRICGKVKPPDEFYRQKTNRDGLDTRCRSCERWRSRRRLYGMGRDEFERKLAAQGGRCAACGTDSPPTSRQNPRGWHIDHDHETGRVRGILCQPCNHIVGVLELDAAAEVVGAYLRQHATE